MEWVNKKHPDISQYLIVHSELQAASTHTQIDDNDYCLGNQLSLFFRE